MDGPVVGLLIIIVAAVVGVWALHQTWNALGRPDGSGPDDDEN
jgi:hypothetical protein